ncbi:MAG TPA: hypothetical protein VLC92_21945 [Rhodocyclaceae bacterium]|nr:hypothetical protein [Rhodocyclaceae bacterium]
MSQSKLALYALLLELSALLQLVMTHSTSDLVFASFMATHAIASAAVASLALLLLPSHLTRSAQVDWLFFFSMVLCVPLLGFCGVMIGLLVAPLLPRPNREAALHTLGLPELDPHENHDPARFRQAGLRHFLRNTRAPIDLRLKALITLQHAPVQFASPVLHDMLADASEDLRLLAYGMLESREKQLNADIREARLARQAAPDVATRRAAERQLATLYWELIYQGLVHGDLRRHAAEESLRFLEQALQDEQGADAGPHLLRGRLLQELGRNEEAEGAYRQSVEHGLPAPRVLPYLAELAFARRDFAEVMRLLGELRAYPDQPRLQPVLRLWGLT